MGLPKGLKDPENQRMRLMFVAITSLVIAACEGKKGASAPDVPVATFEVSGTITYDRVPTRTAAQGGVRLDYSAIEARPARRIIVAAVSNGQEIATTLTDDAGKFKFDIVEGQTVHVRAKARSIVTSYQPDGIAPDHCSGGGWDIRVLNNVTGNPASRTDASLRPMYAAEGLATYGEATTTANLHIPLVYTTSYQSRAAAPFALLDVFISQLELICQGASGQTFPSLIVNWSEDNTSTGSVASTGHLGQIGTSLYTSESATGPNLYILGKENVDTDEYDGHVVAHEFGHYVENNIYRSDSPGGAHSLNDSLDPRLAFGEGFGYAFAAMTFNDPVTVDTSGSGQGTGFQIDASQAPSTTDGKGVYDEFAALHFLWKIFDNRSPPAGEGKYSRIHTVLRNDHRVQAAYTTLNSFAASYYSRFGETAESLRSLWETTLAQAWDALCVGACTGSSDVLDPFDVDNDLGELYESSGRRYRQSIGISRPAEFWRLYRTLQVGLNTATAHDQTLQGGYTLASFINKLGGIRWYRYVHSGATVSRTIEVVQGSLGAGACTDDILDMFVWKNGAAVNWDVEVSGATAGCPSVTFSASAGTYVIELRGKGQAIPSWNMEVK